MLTGKDNVFWCFNDSYCCHLYEDCSLIDNFPNIQNGTVKEYFDAHCANYATFLDVLAERFFDGGIYFCLCHVCQDRANNPQAYKDEGVVIKGVKWATRNLAEKGKFENGPEDLGGLFTWEEAKNACPSGWRLPTKAELEKLVNAGSKWTTQNGINGRLFGTAPNQIFLPAAGRRDCSDGTFNNVGASGIYWSSSERGSNDAYNLVFSSGSAFLEYNRTYGFSVRPVAE